jgi:hypothetical protein
MPVVIDGDSGEATERVRFDNGRISSIEFVLAIGPDG